MPTAHKESTMNNGYTPRQFAHALAIDALNSAVRNRQGELDDLAPHEVTKVQDALLKLKDVLAERAALDIA
jgi:hypothetical protein